MPILHLIDTIDLGGAQTVVKGIVDEQIEATDLHLYALRSKDIELEIKHPNFYVFEGTAKYSFAPLKPLAKLIKEKGISVLHCHLFKSQVFGWRLKKQFPYLKLVFHEHGQIFGTTAVENFAFYNFIRWAKNSVDLFVAVSGATKQLLIERTNVAAEKIEVLYNFVDLTKYDFGKQAELRVSKRAELGVKDDEIVVGTAGRVSTIKGMEYLIRALPKLDFNYRCIVAGEGELRAGLQQLAKDLGVADRVSFLGFVSDMPNLYPAFDIYAMPSLSEASPMTFYEAQAYGKPVVGSNVSAINEFVVPNKNGLLFELKNPEDLAKKLNDLGNNAEKLKRFSENAVKNVQQYGLKAFNRNLQQIYQQKGWS